VFDELGKKFMCPDLCSCNGLLTSIKSVIVSSVPDVPWQHCEVS
jgi:hypothetical protein